METGFPGSDAAIAHPIVRNWGETIWEIPLPEREPAYLHVERSPQCNEKRYVVVVGSARFYHLWLNFGDGHAVPYARLAQDYKFEWVAEDFARGRQQPKTLAQVGGRIDEPGRLESIGFSDGITRTMWLLHHRAAGFPVEVWEKPTADALERAAGLGHPVMSVADWLVQEVRPINGANRDTA